MRSRRKSRRVFESWGSTVLLHRQSAAVLYKPHGDIIRRMERENYRNIFKKAMERHYMENVQKRYEESKRKKIYRVLIEEFLKIVEIDDRD